MDFNMVSTTDMKILWKTQVIILLLATSVFGQLPNLIDKTKAQLSQIVSGQTVPSKSWFEDQIFQRLVELTTAGIQRGYSADDFGSLAAAINRAEADTALLIVSTNESITATDTIRQTAALSINRGGMITLASGTTLRIEGSFFAGPYQVFTGSGTVVFTGTALDMIRPEWWGAKNDLSADAGPAIQKAIDAAPVGSTVKLMPSLASVTTDTAGYLVNTTIRINGLNKQIFLDGAGAAISTTANDTVLTVYGTTPGSNSFFRAMNVVSGIRFRQIGTRGNGVAVSLNNVTFQAVKNCQMQDFNTGVLFYNTFTSAKGWTEHNYLESLRLINCDTAIIFNAAAAAFSSFRNNNFEHIAVPAMGDAKVIQEGGNAVGIAVIGTGELSGVPGAGTPSVYQNSWRNVSMGLTDSTTGFYLNGRAENLWAHLTFEIFDADSAKRSRAFHFGPDASNLMFWIHTDFTARVDLEQAIYNESAYAPQNIYTQLIGQTSSNANGFSTIWDGSHQMFSRSIIDARAFDNWDTSIGDSQIVYSEIVRSDGTVRFRSLPQKPIEFVRVFANSAAGEAISAALGPIRSHNIGRFAFKEDTAQINVANVDFIQFTNSDAAIDTIVNLVDPDTLIGRKLFTLFTDSTHIENLGGGNGQFFFSDGRDRRTHSGLRSMFYSYSDDGAIWREMFTHWPMESTAWNPGDLAQDATDSTTVVYKGAEVGDPVSVGFSGITSSSGGFFELRGHVIVADTIRVYLTNRYSANKDLTGTLRYKIVR